MGGSRGEMAWRAWVVAHGRRWRGWPGSGRRTEVAAADASAGERRPEIGEGDPAEGGKMGRRNSAGGLPGKRQAGAKQGDGGRGATARWMEGNRDAAAGARRRMAPALVELRGGGRRRGLPGDAAAAAVEIQRTAEGKRRLRARWGGGHGRWNQEQRGGGGQTGGNGGRGLRWRRWRGAAWRPGGWRRN